MLTVDDDEKKKKLNKKNKQAKCIFRFKMKSL